jgi:hypothetical protein
MRTSVQWFLARNGWFSSRHWLFPMFASGNTIAPYPEVPASESAVRRQFALPSSAVPKRWTRSVQTALVHVMSLAHYALVQTQSWCGGPRTFARNFLQRLTRFDLQHNRADSRLEDFEATVAEATVLHGHRTRATIPKASFSSSRPAESHDWQVAVPAVEHDIEAKTSSRLSGNKHLWSGTRRTTRPARTRFQAWPTMRGQAAKVHLVGGSTSKRPMRPMLVIPADSQG